jgi:hypothetical protein
VAPALKGLQGLGGIKILVLKAIGIERRQQGVMFMSQSDTVLGRAKVREVAGVFHSYDALDAAVEALLLAGFDRTDIDRMAAIDKVQGKIGPVYVASEELADVPLTPRQAVILREDASSTIALVASVTAAAVAIGTALVMMVSGSTPTNAGVAAVIAAAIAGGIAAVVAWRIVTREKIAGLDSHMTERGIVLWVRVRTPEREDVAQKILMDHGARAVRVHEIEIEKTTEEIPLSSLRPDPWLGSERLGQL